jgi:hypothetical protein
VDNLSVEKLWKSCGKLYSYPQAVENFSRFSTGAEVRPSWRPCVNVSLTQLIEDREKSQRGYLSISLTSETEKGKNPGQTHMSISLTQLIVRSGCVLSGFG